MLTVQYNELCLPSALLLAHKLIITELLRQVDFKWVSFFCDVFLAGAQPIHYLCKMLAGSKKAFRSLGTVQSHCQTNVIISFPDT